LKGEFLIRISELKLPEHVKKLWIDEGLDKLYPPQELAIKKGLLDGKNLVLAAPTASGKTLIAEMAMLNSILNNNGKALYLVPLRALASEKYDEFKKYQKIGLKIAVTTGDYDRAEPWLKAFDCIIATNEKADSLLRHQSSWINEVTILVLDEVHLINDPSRGPTLEAVIAKLRYVNPDAQILALSATIKNAYEIAEWLNAELVLSEWRPVTLNEGVYFNGKVFFGNGETKEVTKKSRDAVVNLALETVEEGGQALIFTNTRKSTVTTAVKVASAIQNLLKNRDKKMLKKVSTEIIKSGEVTSISKKLAELVNRGVAFHHAGLSHIHRKIIEDYFRRNLIKVICATPTLAAGVNLPARRVIIRNYRRYEANLGYYPIPVLEYKQMAGRAGRPKYDEVGEALLLAKTNAEKDLLFEEYVLGEPEKIWSKLASESALRTHILSVIATGFARNDEGLFDFINGTFYAHQYDTYNIVNMVNNVLTFLIAENMITKKEKTLQPTTFGKRVSELYIDPVSGVIIRDALMKVKGVKLTPLSLIHLTCHTPDMPKLYLRQRDYRETDLFIEEHYDEFLTDIPDPEEEPYDYEFFMAEVKTSRMILDWIEEASEEDLITKYDVGPGDIMRTMENAEWILHAIYELSRLFKVTHIAPLIWRVERRVKKGVKDELLDLVELEGIGRVRARMLYNAGIRTIQDLKKIRLQKLVSIPYIGREIARKIKEQVGGTLTPEEWEEIKSNKNVKQRSLSDF